MDELKKIFEEQKEFQLFFYDPDRMSIEEKVAMSKEYFLSATRELGEALNVLPWKSHRKYDNKEINLPEFREELIDVIKFVLNLYVIWGVSADDFVSDFFAKSAKVRSRLEAEKEHVKTLK